MKNIIYAFILITSFLSISFHGIAQETLATSDSVYNSVDEAPTFPGGTKQFYIYISKNLSYPKQARRMGIQGRVFVKFTVTKTGTITNPLIIRGIGGGCDEVALLAVQNSPNWNPGTKDGKPVNASVVMPILFKLNKKKRPDRIAAPIGGYEKFQAYVKVSTKYPKKAKKSKIEGTVTLSITLNKSGEIENIIIKQGLGYGLDKEAIRLVKKGPRWTPELKNGQIVTSTVDLGIEFKL